MPACPGAGVEVDAEVEYQENEMSATITRVETAFAPLARPWTWTLAYGISCALVGLAVLVWPHETLRIVAVLFAVQLIAASAFRFVVSFIRTGESMVQKLLMAALATFAFVLGVVLLGNLSLSLRFMAIVLGIYWAIHGVIELVESISHDCLRDRAWVVASGTMGVVVGLILVLAGAFPSIFLAFRGPLLLLLITRTLGVWLVVFGVMLVVRAFRLRPPQPASGQTPGGLRPAGT
jgi:uncharacterized membrane protein HdeD (DUF308 family)